MSESMIARTETSRAVAEEFGTRPGDTWNDRDSGASYVLTDESAAAMRMLGHIKRVRADLNDSAVPTYRHVLSGVKLMQHRETMLAAHWLAQAQRDRGKRGGRPPEPPGRMIEVAKERGFAWEKIDAALLRRHDMPTNICGFVVRLFDDGDKGRFVVTDESGRTSKPVKLETLHDYYSR